ncbi:FxSxx-COOH system tetratricopeptide repeat protein [Polymorphospora lycopeni]|uniref:FxSxx-COOH system tetratricopeptide repeat protein n=1 Tax=Polymorphospora lycopeni TaxID=3140240 RepID=A0ABV5CLQ9_9ACTN
MTVRQTPTSTATPATGAAPAIEPAPATGAEPAAGPEPGGEIITFYSYKGGTGRTMAVANVAWILASNGKRVLVIDWDLESPGLHRYLHPFLVDKQLRSSPGIIDMIRSFSEATLDPNGPSQPGWHRDHARILDYASTIEWDHFPDDGMLDFVPAGRQDRHYSRAVTTFDWNGFFERLHGGVFLQALRDDLKANYDYVLIDSRTGLSDAAGICTVLLPDTVVNCFTMNTQSIEGAAAVAYSIQTQRGDRPVRMLPAPMRVEDGEQGKVEAGRDFARLRFRPMLAHLDAAQADRYWGNVEIPYRAYYAYEEILSTFGDRPYQDNSLLGAYERLTTVLTNGEVQHNGSIEERERLRRLADFERQRLRPSEISEVFLTYSAVDRLWAEWIAAELADAGMQAVLHEIDARPGGGRMAEAERLVRTTSAALVLLSRDFLAAPGATDLWKRLVGAGSGPVPRSVVVARLDATRPPAPYLDRTQVDLSDRTEQQASELLLDALGLEAVPPDGDPRAESAGGRRPRFPTGQPRVRNIQPRYSTFTGRVGILDDLRDRLATRASRTLPQALHGMAGVGKTQVAREYANRFAADYDVVWWISAEQESVVRDRLVELGRELGLPAGNDADEAVRTVLTALQQGRPYARWLIIYDNVDDPASVDGLIPHGPGHVLLTSRDPAWATRAEGVSVGVFHREESIALLRRHVESITDDDAELVAEKMGDLPLALEQAAAWLAETLIPVPELLRQIERQLVRVLSAPVPGGYSKTVAAMWQLALEKVRERQPAAARLMELCAFFSAEPIPTSLIYSDRCLQVLTEYDPSLTDPLMMGPVIREINRYALAQVGPGQSSIQVHRLIQLMIREELSPEKRDENRRHVHEILAGAQPSPKDPDNPDNWSRYAELWPHLLPSKAVESRSTEVRQLIIDVVRYLHKRNDYAGSRLLAERARARWEEVFGADDRLTLLVRFHRANVLRAQGHDRDAHDENHDVYDRFKATVGETNPYTLMAARSLAADHRMTGDYVGARELDERTLRQLRSTLSDEHPHSLMVANNLAVSLRLVGDYQAAAALDLDTLEKRRRVLGERHPYTLFSAGNYGRDLREIGDFPAARRTLERTLRTYEEVLGESHTETLRTAKSLAVTLRKLGDYAAARRLTDSSLQHYLHGPGRNHPDTVTCLLNLASDDWAVRDLRSALDRAEEARAEYQRIIPANRTFSLICTNNIAVFTRALGDHERARALSAEVADEFGARLNDNHPYTLTARLNLANSLFSLGDVTRAREIDEDVHRRLADVFGPGHPETLTAEANLALSLGAVGEVEQGRRVGESVLAKFGALLGHEHPTTKVVRAGERLSSDLEPPLL